MVRFFYFFTFFFENRKNVTFLGFLRCCTRFLEHWSGVYACACDHYTSTFRAGMLRTMTSLRHAHHNFPLTISIRLTGADEFETLMTTSGSEKSHDASAHRQSHEHAGHQSIVRLSNESLSPGVRFCSHSAVPYIRRIRKSYAERSTFFIITMNLIHHHRLSIDVK